MIDRHKLVHDAEITKSIEAWDKLTSEDKMNESNGMYIYTEYAALLRALVMLKKLEHKALKADIIKGFFNKWLSFLQFVNQKTRDSIREVLRDLEDYQENGLIPSIGEYPQLSQPNRAQRRALAKGTKNSI